MEQEYKVTWVIELSASSPLEAARKALATQRDPQSLAVVFEVQAVPSTKPPVEIDLAEDRV